MRSSYHMVFVCYRMPCDKKLNHMMSNPAATRPSTRATTCQSTANSTARGRGKRTATTTSTRVSPPAAKRCRETDPLTRNDIPDIVLAVLQAIPTASAKHVVAPLALRPALLTPIHRAVLLIHPLGLPQAKLLQLRRSNTIKN